MELRRRYIVSVFVTLMVVFNMAGFAAAQGDAPDTPDEADDRPNLPDAVGDLPAQASDTAKAVLNEIQQGLDNLGERLQALLGQNGNNETDTDA